MTVRGIDHINFRGSAKSLEALRAFYGDVLGLQTGPRPPLQSSGLWLYAGDAPIVHLVETPDAEVIEARSGAAPALDHIALHCSDLEQMLAGLRRRGIEHAVNEVPAAGQIQVRLRDPSGLTVELIFAIGRPSTHENEAAR